MSHLFSYFLTTKSDGPYPQGDGFGFPKKKYSPDLMKKLASTFLVVLSFALIINHFFLSAPNDFRDGFRINIQSGMTVEEIGGYLESNSMIRSPFIFKALVKVYGREGGVLAGGYLFEKPTSVFGVVKTVTNREYRAKVFRVVIPEGLSNRQVGDLLEKNLNNFDKKKFILLAEKREGYLFPDTYFFEPETSPEKVIEMMNENFLNRIKKVMTEITASKRSLSEIIIMASILEEEARTEETRKMISGILWKRIDKSMPLQVDASFVYLMNKGSADLTLDDLKIDSPYNTYKYKGLPAGPITNPGLGAILDAAEPISNPYWFYLSDKYGDMHYSKTFEEHVANKVKYLR